MTGAARRPAGPRLASLALDALRRRDAHRAWLFADSLVRQAARSQLVDALLLRAAAVLQLGDAEAAEADIALAAHVEPFNPAVNASLLNHTAPRQRMAAARRLLAAEEPPFRARGWGALAREGLDCVGTLTLVDGRLRAEIAWRGRAPIGLRLTASGHALAPAEAPVDLSVDPGEAAPPPGFDSTATIAIPLAAGADAVRLTAPDRRALFEPGTLLLPSPHRAAPTRPLPSPGLLVIVPVYDDAEATRACLDRLLLACPPSATRRVLVVDDVSPAPAIRDLLDRLAAQGRIELHRNTINLGFAGSVNRALAERPAGWDALLLNADTLVPAGAIERLAAHLASEDVGTVTPLSNNGEDTSIPQRFRVNPMPSPAEIERIDAVAQRASPGVAVDMPNGVGFCLYIRGSLLDRVGPLSHAFGRGYYEDVEFCLRAAEAGFRNVCAADVFVGHHGGRSFGGDKRALVAANLRRLEQRFPSYRARSETFEAEDPLRPAVARLEAALIATGPAFDLLAVPEDMPQSLATFAATALGRGTLIARIRSAESGLGLSLRGQDGAMPQSIHWSFAGSPDEARSRLESRLGKLPLRSIALLAEDSLPAPLRDAASGLRCPIRSLSTDGQDLARRLAGADRPALRAPRPGERPLLAVVLPDPSREDCAWVEALAEELAPSLTTIVAGQVSMDDGSTVISSGPIPDDELPDWLERLGARGILFASRRWGGADPRAALWRARGVPVAWRQRGPAASVDGGAGLGLPDSIAIGDAAARLSAWLGSPPPALGFAQGADQDAVDRLLATG